MLAFYVVLAVLGLYGLAIAGMDAASANMWSSVIMDVIIGVACAVSLYKLYGKGFLTGQYSGSEENSGDKGRFLALACALFVLVWVAGQLAFIGYEVLSGQVGSSGLQFASANISPLYLLLTVFLAPIAEELLFRGLIYKRIASTRVPALLAAFTVSLLFAVLHGAVPARFFDTFIISMFLSLAYEKTGNLLLCMGFHAVNNVATLLIGGQMVPDFLTNGCVDFALWAAVLIAIAYLMVRKSENSEKELEEGTRKKKPRKKDTTAQQQKNQQRKQRKKKK